QAIRRIDELTPQAIKCDQGGIAQFFAILTVPCFEVWTLLHKKSLGSRQMTSKEILRELEKVIPDYKKNKSGMFDRLYTELGGAIQRAETLLAISSAPADTKTYVHDLVRFLLSQVR
ncbi:MAG: RloB domain-containing protein, partial [Duodenibacillus sp.]